MDHIKFAAQVLTVFMQRLSLVLFAGLALALLFLDMRGFTCNWA